MSQPNTTSQKPKPPSAAEKNLSLWRYLPRSTPSMSETATLTRLPGELRTASSTFLAGRSFGMDCIPPGLAGGDILPEGLERRRWHNLDDERSARRWPDAACAFARCAARGRTSLRICRSVRKMACAAASHDRVRAHAHRQRRIGVAPAAVSRAGYHSW